MHRAVCPGTTILRSLLVWLFCLAGLNLQAANLTAYFPLDEASGTTVTDRITGSVATVTNLVFGQPGLVGAAARFTETNLSSINLGTNSNVSLAGPFSVVFWAKATTNGFDENERLLDVSNGDALSSVTKGFDFKKQNGCARLFLADGVTNLATPITTSLVSVSSNVWYLFAIRFEPASAPEKTTDGLAAVTAVAFNPNIIDATAVTSRTLLVTNHSLGSLVYDRALLAGVPSGTTPTTALAFDGWMDDLRFYDAVLSDAELAAIYNQVASGTNTPPGISTVSNQTIFKNGYAQIPFTVGDAEYPASLLMVSGYSSNQGLVQDQNIQISSTGSNRVVNVLPEPGVTGSVQISLVASDGQLQTTNTFTLNIILPPGIITALNTGEINDPNNWDAGFAPVPADTNLWFTDNNALYLSNSVETFNGQTLLIEPGGKFSPNKPGVTFTVNNLVLDGGAINMANNLGLTINLSGKTFTLNSGSLKSGGLNNGRNIIFQNGSLAGSGAIDIIGTDTNGSDVEFQSTIATTNFTGTFSVHDYGILNLSSITPNQASFSLDLETNGLYWNDANVAVYRLTIAGVGVAKGVYAYSNFTPAQQAFIGNQGGTITVVADPDPLTVPPAAPGGLAVTPLSGSQMNISWQDNSGSEDGFELSWGLGTSSNQTEVVVPLPAHTTNYLQSGLLGNTAYYYRVKATRAFPGNSTNTPTVSATTLNDGAAGVFSQDLRVGASADDAEETQASPVQFAGVTNNFTLMAWINPTGGRAGPNGTTGQRYAIFPTDGTLYGQGPNHVGVGISVGTNGVGVFENSASMVSNKLEFATTLTNWTHVAVTYSNGVPRLFINGTLVGTGAASAGKIPHPGSWGSSSWGWFKGFLDEFRVYQRALTGAEIIQIIKVES